MTVRALVMALAEQAQQEAPYVEADYLRVLGLTESALERFAVLVAEECAKLCEADLHSTRGLNVFVPGEARLIGEHDRATRSAAAIRAKFPGADQAP